MRTTALQKPDFLLTFRAPLEKVSAFFRRSELSRFLCSFHREFLYALLFTAVVNLLMLTPTLYMLQIFDRVLVSYNEFTLLAVTLMLLFFLGVMSFSEWVRGRLLVRLGVKLDMALNGRVFAAAFQYRERGEDGGGLLIDLARLRQFLTGNGLFALMDTPWTPIYILVLFLLHPLLGILAIIFCLILWGIAYIASRVVEEPLETAGQADQKESAWLRGKMRHVVAVNAMGMLWNLQRAWLKKHRVTLLQGSRGQDAQARIQAITRFVRLCQQSSSLAAGALLVIHGEISPGAMIAANVLVSRATHPVDALTNAWKDMRSTWRAFLRLEAALEALPPALSTAKGVDIEGVSEVVGGGFSVELVEAQASAPNRSQPLLKDISLKIPAGMALAVNGASGSGKSTLVRMMLGIWPGTEGEVLIDGLALREWHRPDLGRHVGYLPQNVELFTGTVAENIARFGKLEPEKIIAASQQAGVHDMILRFPKGYDTEIGEGGRFLSGGQRQRIGLARALYGDPRLIVLDEPDANLDDAGDHALLEAILKSKERGATLVLVTHRPGILKVMDSLLTLEGGKVARWSRLLRPASAAGFSGL